MKTPNRKKNFSPAKSSYTKNSFSKNSYAKRNDYQNEDRFEPSAPRSETSSTMDIKPQHFNSFKPHEKIQSKNDFSFFATCGHYLEPLLVTEIKKFKIENCEQAYLGASFQSNIEKALNLLLETRLSSGIYLKLHQEMIKTPHDLSSLAASLPWNEILSPKLNYTIESVLSSIRFEDKQLFNSPLYTSQKFKDGINDFFKNKNIVPPKIDPKHHDFKLKLIITGMNDVQNKIKGYEVGIFLDIANYNLGNRGNRPSQMRAPLRETLACALVRSMELKKDEIFLDGMCGSGTMGIEYLLEKMNLPAQYLNLMNEFYPYSFLKMPWFQKSDESKSAWKKIVTEKTKFIFNQLNYFQKNPINLVFNDISPKSIKDAKLTLQQSKLPCAPIFSQLDITQKSPQEFIRLIGKGEKSFLVFTNPPYGVRMEPDEVEKLEKLYFELGENMKKQFKDSRFFIFSANMEMLKKVRLRPIKKLPFYNGALSAKFYEYPLH